MSALVRRHPAVDPWSFDRAALIELGRAHHRAYQEPQPFPHVVVEGLLGDARSAALARAFPSPSHPGRKRRDYAEQLARLGQLQLAPHLASAGHEACMCSA